MESLLLQLLTALCVGLAVSPASSAPIVIATSDPLAPVLGKTFKLDHCDDLRGFFHSIGLSHEAILLSKKMKVEETLIVKDGELTSIKDLFVPVNGVERKFSVESPYKFGQEVRKTVVGGEGIRYTVTREGNTLTKKWHRGGTHGTTVSIYGPEEIKTTVKTNGETFHCFFSPVCPQGDPDCDNQL